MVEQVCDMDDVRLQLFKQIRMNFQQLGLIVCFHQAGLRDMILVYAIDWNTSIVITRYEAFCFFFTLEYAAHDYGFVAHPLKTFRESQCICFCPMIMCWKETVNIKRDFHRLLPISS